MRGWLFGALTMVSVVAQARAEIRCDYAEVTVVTTVDPDTQTPSVTAGAQTFAQSGVMWSPPWPTDGIEFILRLRDSFNERVTYYLRIDEESGMFNLQYFERDGSSGAIDAIHGAELDSGVSTVFDSGQIFGRQFRCSGAYK